MKLLTLRLLGLMVLAGGGHCLFQFMDSVRAEVVQSVKGKGFPIGGSWSAKDQSLVQIFLDSLGECICVDFKLGGSTKQQQCQCKAELLKCDEKYKETIDTTLDEVSDLANGWMTCVGNERLVAAYKCRARMFSQAFELACKAQGNTCP